MIVHPEVGKWLIALGEKAFGMDPFGWRIAAAVVGSLMVLVMCRLARRMTGSTAARRWSPGLLLCFDGLQFVLSRLALLDIFLAFFMLCAVHCLVADRDWYRARLARLVPDQVGRHRRRAGPVRGLLFRPWLLAAGVCWGLAIGTKWTALYPLAAFGLLVGSGAPAPAGPSASAARCCGRRSPTASRRSSASCWSACVVYVATWTGWLMHADEYEKDLSSTQYTQYTGQGHCDDKSYVLRQPRQQGRWPTASEPDASGAGRGRPVAAVALVLPPATSTRSTPTS